MKKFTHPFFLIFIFLFVHNFISAQTKRCRADEHRAQNAARYPELLQQQEQNELAYQDYIRNAPLNKTSSGTKYVIPVVVHVMHFPPHAKNLFTNISDERVYEQIRILNEDYRRVGIFNQNPKAADVQIEFVLATKDPNGNCHSGINRIPYDSTYVFDDLDTLEAAEMKALSHWPRDKYLNIYTVGKFKDPVAGYSTFADETGNPHLDSVDGIVMDYHFFGLTYDRHLGIGRTTTHEVGHWLGLFHTWEGGCTNNNCLADGDKICDTPPLFQARYDSICGTIRNTCFTDDDDLGAQNPFRPIALGGDGDQNDMIENFMDYTDDSCMNIFTPGQADRIKFFLYRQRFSIWQDNNLTATAAIGLPHEFDTVGISTQLNGRVTAMTEWNGKLVIAGEFTLADGKACTGLVTWDGNTYETIPGTPNFAIVSTPVTSMAAFQATLLALNVFPFTWPNSPPTYNLPL